MISFVYSYVVPEGNPATNSFCSDEELKVRTFSVMVTSENWILVTRAVHYDVQRLAGRIGDHRRDVCGVHRP